MWNDLKQRADAARENSILELCQQDSRFEDFSIKHGDLLFDYSKTHLKAADLDMLVDMAKDVNISIPSATCLMRPFKCMV